MRDSAVHRKTFYVFLFLGFFVPSFLGFLARCFAGDAEIFSKANSLYEAGRYDEAIRQYNSILESGAESGNLYYNLGNCFFKKGEWGRAILHYERARRLMPRDRDLESNDEYVRSLVKGGEVTSQKSLSWVLLQNLFGRLTIEGLTILLSALYILVLTGVLASLFLPVKRHAFVFAVFAGLFFIAGLAGLREKIALMGREGIVIAKQADAKFEPMGKATTHFTLYEGMKVKVIFSQNHWLKVRRQDNKSGWIENSAVAVF